jgi:hypothetical protein
MRHVCKSEVAKTKCDVAAKGPTDSAGSRAAAGGRGKLHGARSRQCACSIRHSGSKRAQVLPHGHVPT